MRNNKPLCVIIAVITAVAAAVTTAAFFIKRHRRKYKYPAFALVAVLIICGTSLTVYAGGGEGADTGEIEIDLTQIITPIFEPQPSPEPTPQPQSLTPPGNLSLVDDFSNVQEDNKQFITVVTKSGHYFYIIIDRAGDRQNVHFLNLVDEYDLWAILDEDAPRPTAPTPIEITPELITEPESEPEPEPEQGNSIGGILIMLVLIGAIGGGAYYYFKVLKPGQSTAKADASQIDEFVFDDDEDDFGNPTGDYDGDYTSTDESAEHGGMDYITGYSADHEDDMPDFTAQEPDGALPFESADLGEETPESEDK